MTKGGELMAKTKRNVQDNYNTVFAKRLRELIESTGVSQAELANSVSVTRQAINSYTLGNTVPNSDVLTDIAKYFDVSSDYLLGLIDIKSNDITVKLTVSKSSRKKREPFWRKTLIVI